MPSDAIDKISFRVDEAVKASGLGRSFLYEKMSEGRLRSIKIGGRRLILKTDLVAFLNHGVSTWKQAPLHSQVIMQDKPIEPLPPAGGQLELPFHTRK
ncbi:helix-turn-helix domain-containing protein [Asticcacaulis taihuensis]|uniref:DNA binding domain-containing protein, excisionase family n=1 Tax=Asticcacaulis taihuensis TaxID=260084 RepID=A0A1G4TVA7_9CAUL|nr:helix-turn-helix domain-containing protein [Asticcacaulis taihuensis]SCW85343.1 DNA binding domain-containing protein, excisionase family [Asticcacaulis taihuensis]